MSTSSTLWWIATIKSCILWWKWHNQLWLHFTWVSSVDIHHALGNVKQSCVCRWLGLSWIYNCSSRPWHYRWLTCCQCHCWIRGCGSTIDRVLFVHCVPQDFERVRYISRLWELFHSLQSVDWTWIIILRDRAVEIPVPHCVCVCVCVDYCTTVRALKVACASSHVKVIVKSCHISDCDTRRCYLPVGNTHLSSIPQAPHIQAEPWRAWQGVESLYNFFFVHAEGGPVQKVCPCTRKKEKRIRAFCLWFEQPCLVNLFWTCLYEL